jgi:hypothetical protein
MSELHESVKERISSTPALDTPAVWQLADWRNGREQLEWLLTATVSEILKAAETVELDTP